MKISHICLIALCLILVVKNDITEDVKVQSLSKDWLVKILEISGGNEAPAGITQNSYPTSIPTTIHLDLLKHNKIPDPFFRDNYLKLKWVQRISAKYSKNFTIDPSDLSVDKAIQLVFHGIDTYSQISINGHNVLNTSNAFRRYVARIQKFAQENNILEVKIFSTQLYDETGQKQNNMPFKYAHTRKACYQYSWDWAPEINTLGIWKDVELRVFKQIRFDYVWARNKQISQHQAIINFAAKLNINTFKDQPLSEGYTFAVYLNDEMLCQKKINQDTVYADVNILNPQFWWPNGIGSPYIYDFSIRILRNQEIIDVKLIPYGIRTVKLDLSQKQFKFILNGYPIYAKGANYVPLDMLYPRLTNSEYQSKNTIAKLIDDAVESNFNMIRIWGGGQYESDQFLELASRKGIMIFYDFMFSDSIYPSTEQFLLNVEEQVKQQIRRARNYPALALWCGNNQILQGIQQWGWGQAAYQTDYNRLFQILIKKVVQIENPDISYIPSSPIYGVGNYDFTKGGDFHYWGVWAGGRQFQSYRGAVGPFNSQFGTQALPVWHTIKQFTQIQDRNYQSRILLTHERHGSQFKTLQSYRAMYMKNSTNFEMQAYQSGVLQAFAIEIAIVAQRIAKPKCYGTLYWQMNDAWPAISWSSIDYYGRWKPLQYMAKRLYPNIAIFIENGTKAIAINDNLYQVLVEVKVKIISFTGIVKHQKSQNIALEVDSIHKIEDIAPLTENEKSTHMIYCQILHDQVVTMKSTYFYKKFKQLDLPDATLEVFYNVSKNTITVKSDQLIKNLFIDHEDEYIKLSDNYFDVIPGYPVTINLDFAKKLGNVKDKLKYVSLRQASSDEKLKVKITSN